MNDSPTQVTNAAVTSSALGVLQERGFLQQCTDIQILDELLNKGSVGMYTGFDPTGPSLHVGHVVPLFAMAHMARCGHTVYALIGGGTAKIGDPSGKSEMRKMLTPEQIAINGESIGRQIMQFFQKAGVSPDRVRIVNNSEWLDELRYIEFLRNIGKHFSVNRMLSFETYKMRMETGLSFIEFNYQLLQSYDFMVLNRDHGVQLQAGGDDQWGNIVAGIDLIRRTGGKQCFGLTYPLITRTDGKKMGKTEKGAVFLDPALTSPYDFFQYWRNIPDQDVGSFLKVFTFMDLAEIEQLSHLEGQAINEAKERLALEFTRLIHGEVEAQKALETARSAFGSSAGADISAMPSLELPREEFQKGIGVLDLFARTSLCASRSEARRLVTQGGARIQDQVIHDPETIVQEQFIQDGQLILKAGKKRFFRIILVP